jgi:hypothetical protein
MPHESHGLSLATTASGLVGGLFKAVTDHASATTVTVAGAIDVAFYAIVSASVGYGVKLTLDRLVARKRQKR